MKNLRNFLYKLKIEFKNVVYKPSLRYKNNQKFNYDIYWDVRNKSNNKHPNLFHQYRAELLRKFILKNKISLNSQMLDIGSGDGRQLNAIKQKMSKLKITASDISKKSLEKLSHNFEIINIKPNTDFITKEYNLITAFEVFEHLEEPEEYFLYLLSKTNNALIFSVPNTGYIFHRLRLIFGYFPYQWKTFPGEHLRFWTYKDMKWWLSTYLGIDKKNFKVQCYASISPSLNKLIPFLSPLLAKGLFIYVIKE